MSKREAVYDTKIAPALLKLSKACERAGLSMVTLVEWEPGETGRTACIQPEASFALRLVDTACQAQGNVDSLIWAIMRHARTHGHSSVCLQQLGVPTSPDPAPTATERLQ